ncbi:MAG: hypothetical protein PHQ43_01055 [Dehalococcoidales bacterium]|nr:hypothetical protein [Dehalococcoidales bacterium]
MKTGFLYLLLRALFWDEYREGLDYGFMAFIVALGVGAIVVAIAMVSGVIILAVWGFGYANGL